MAGMMLTGTLSVTCDWSLLPHVTHADDDVDDDGLLVT